METNTTQDSDYGTDADPIYEEAELVTDTDSVLTEEYTAKIRPVLDAVDELRVVGIDEEIQLPTIVVCGDQSVGKSSVLEQISGVQLPRGSGIVTRCPLELRLRCTPDERRWRGRLEYHDLQGVKHSVTLDSPADVGPAVKTAQDEMTGDKKSICAKIISLLVESPHVPNLTLIDLPGIARFTQEESDVPFQTKELIRKYIQRTEVIVIVVVPCSVDIETVESLEMARQVDPQFERTIGVLTFPDMVNPGAEKHVIATLNGKGQVKLVKGFTVVKCRSQAELDADVDLGEAIKSELNFFRNHNHYKYLSKELYGTSTLAHRLGVELLSRIKATLLGVRGTLTQKICETQAEFDELSKNIPDTYAKKRYLVTSLITQFCDRLERSATGDTRHPRKCQELVRMAREVSEEFATLVRQYIDPKINTGLLEAVKKYVIEQRLRELPGFINVYPIVERLVIDEFIKPISESVLRISTTMRNNIEKVVLLISNDVLGQHKNIEKHVLGVLEDYNLERYNEAQALLDLLLKMEKYVWTQDTTYMKYQDYGKNYDCNSGETQTVSTDDEITEEILNENPGVDYLSETSTSLSRDIDKKKKRSSGIFCRSGSKKQSAITNTSSVSSRVATIQRTPSKVRNGTSTEEHVEASVSKTTRASPAPISNANATFRNDDIVEAILCAFINYLKISGQRVMDYAPLMVMEKQMTQLATEVKNILLQFPSDEKSLDMLLVDDEVIIKKKEEMSNRLIALKNTDAVFKNIHHL